MTTQALVVLGGQSPIFTFRDHEELKNALRTFYEADKVTSALSHGTAALIDVLAGIAVGKLNRFAGMQAKGSLFTVGALARSTQADVDRRPSVAATGSMLNSM
jgi:putative intracellular protease/amidase